MFDRDRLFKVLYTLFREPDDFLVAQDAYTIIQHCICQVREIEKPILELTHNLGEMSAQQRESELYTQNQSMLERMIVVRANSQRYQDFLGVICCEAGSSNTDYYLTSFLPHRNFLVL
jgi:hypothetical protein